MGREKEREREVSLVHVEMHLQISANEPYG